MNSEQMELVTMQQVVEAYYQCLRGKRNTYDALRFEANAESECVRLWEEINSGSYRPSRSIVFISNYPVKREIFGAAFRDRVVDTIFAAKIVPVLERRFIEDNYSTRVDKGTLYGIHRVDQMIRQRSENYTRDCWVMKLDMQSYFMSLPKDQVYQKFRRIIMEDYHEADRDMLLHLLRVIINDRPEQHCVLNSRREEWVGLPHNKSLFYSDGLHGLPIGKVISQMSALVYMDDLDQIFQQPEYSDISYGHYMDDMVLVGCDPQRLAWIRDNVIDNWAKENGVHRHPKKMQLQHYSKGVLFTGGMIKPGRIYLSRRTIGNCFTKLQRYNLLAANHQGYAEKHYQEFMSVMNSYLGLMTHFSARHWERRIARMIDKEWYRYIYFSRKGHRCKLVLRTPYREKTQALTCLRKEIHSLFEETTERKVA